MTEVVPTAHSTRKALVGDSAGTAASSVIGRRVARVAAEHSDAGCSGSGDDATCLHGLGLQGGGAVPFACACLKSSVQPECRAADCESQGLLWLPKPSSAAQG